MISYIPLVKAPGEQRKLNISNSSFVELHENDRISIKMMYVVFNMDNAEPKCFVREEVAKMLNVAAGYLPLGYKLLIYDAWRPFALQSELYYSYRKVLLKRFKEDEVKNYVSEPTKDSIFPPVHTTGGAVDVTIIDDKGNPLVMGTEFDSFSEATHTAYFEKNNSIERDNRRILYSVMTQAGFTNLPSEWWHYDYGDRFYGYYKGVPAIYDGVFTREEIHEKRYTEH